MKRSTALFKQANFTYSNLKKLKKSIRHSLQLIDKLHFNPELTRSSWLYVEASKEYLLSIPEADRENIAEQAILRIGEQFSSFKQQNSPTSDEAERIKITKTISKRRTDLTNELKKGSYTEKQRQVVDIFLSKIKKPVKDQTDSYFSVAIPNKAREKILSRFKGTKAAKLLDKIIELHNARITKPVRQQAVFGRTVVMQESFFKIPLHNQVELDPDDYHNILKSFMTKYFPDHPIELAMFHGNEKAKGEPDYNAHCHIFINAQNSKTHRYDLIDRSREVANDFAKQNGLAPIPKTLDGMKLVGEYRQKLFYQHANVYLAQKQRGVELYVLPETEERRRQRMLIREDANKPKELRFYNQINYQQKRINEDAAQIRQIQAQQDDEKLRIGQLQTELKRTEAHLTEQQNRLNRLMKGMLQVATNIMTWARLIFNINPKPADDKRLEIIQVLDRIKPDVLDDDDFQEVREVLDEANRLAEQVENTHNLTIERKISPFLKRIKRPSI